MESTTGYTSSTPCDSVGYFTWKLDWNPWLAYSASGVSRVGIRGVSKSHKFKGLVKVGASKGVMRVDLKKNHGGGGGCRATRNPLDTPLGVCIDHSKMIEGIDSF